MSTEEVAPNTNAGESSLSQLIQHGNYVLFKLPSGFSKVAKVNRGSMVELGKFGKFRADDILGKPLGIPYEIYDRDHCREAPSGAIFDDYDIEEDPELNNREIHDDGESQALSHADIEELKRAARTGERSGQEVIKTLLESNLNIEKKTTFSRAKLHKRKEMKYSRIFTPIQTSARALCEYYFEQKPSTIRQLRLDTLSQMMTIGNVGPGWRGIVVDECGGLLIGAVMERLGGQGEIVALHIGDQVSHSVLNFMNDVGKGVKLWNLPWGKLTAAPAKASSVEGREKDVAMPAAEDGPAEEEEAANGDGNETGDAEPNDGDGDQDQPDDGDAEMKDSETPEEEAGEPEEATNRTETETPEDMPREQRRAIERRKRKEQLFAQRLEKKEARKAVWVNALSELHKGGFHAMLSVSAYHATNVVAALSFYLAGSATFAVYNPMKEPLTETYLWLRGSGMPFINVQLTETFLREWQAKKGRMHPEMNTSGTGGFLLSGIKTVMEPNPPSNFMSKIGKNKGEKRKGEDKVKEMEESGAASSPAPSGDDAVDSEEA